MLDRLDIIIPVLDGAEHLAATLKNLPPVNAVIVVDGGSTDASANIASANGACLIHSARGRGRQLAAGAEASIAPWLLFLHADTRLDTEAWTALADYINRPDAVRRAAVFRFKLNDPAWQARVLEVGVRLRGAVLALPYGDQGLLIHRDLYQAVGGFADMVLMEDVHLVRRLGRRRLRRLDGAAVTSAERWRRRGWIGQSALNLSCLCLYLFGIKPSRIARLYGR